jgi:hypothetical protein
MIVLQLVMMMVEAMRYAHKCTVEVNRLDYSCREIDSIEKLRTGLTMFVKSRSPAVAAALRIVY